ncbi:MAG: T9SS type A sorting domain-containing protein [Saprospiraceae bacterium]
MNNLFKILGIILCASSLSAQIPYLPLATEGKYWFYTASDNIDGPNGAVHSIYVIHIKGDTLIDGKAYKKVFKCSLKTYFAMIPPYQFVVTPYTITGCGVVSFIREDTLTKQVFNRPANNSIAFCDSSEYLLFDFGLQTGDTLHDCVLKNVFLPQFSIPIVDSISVEQIFQKNRRTLNSFGHIIYQGLAFASSFRISEGLGYETQGIFNQNGEINDGHLHHLFDFCEGDLNGCGFVGTNESQNFENKWVLFPNPASSEVSIFPAELFLKIEVFDLAGNLEMAALVEQKTDISKLSRGLKLIKLIDRKGHASFGKLLKI